MAGGPSTPELVAAVSNAGALGSLGSAYSTPEQIAADIKKVRALTGKPFNVNLFAGGYTPESPVDAAPMLALLGEIHEALRLPPPALPAVAQEFLRGAVANRIGGSACGFQFHFRYSPARRDGAPEGSGDCNVRNGYHCRRRKNVGSKRRDGDRGARRRSRLAPRNFRWTLRERDGSHSRTGAFAPRGGIHANHRFWRSDGRPRYRAGPRARR